MGQEELPIPNKPAAPAFTESPLFSFLRNAIENSTKTGSKALHLGSTMTDFLLQLINNEANHQRVQLQLIEQNQTLSARLERVEC